MLQGFKYLGSREIKIDGCPAREYWFSGKRLDLTREGDVKLMCGVTGEETRVIIMCPTEYFYS